MIPLKGSEAKRQKWALLLAGSVPAWCAKLAGERGGELGGGGRRMLCESSALKTTLRGACRFLFPYSVRRRGSRGAGEPLLSRGAGSCTIAATLAWAEPCITCSSEQWTSPQILIEQRVACLRRGVKALLSLSARPSTRTTRRHTGGSALGHQERLFSCFATQLVRLESEVSVASVPRQKAGKKHICIHAYVDVA